MSFEVLVTIMGRIEDQAEAERIAKELEAAVARAGTLGCVIEIRDSRLARSLRQVVVPVTPL